MPLINNVCPICARKEEFELVDYRNFKCPNPKGPWAMPCYACQDKIADYFQTRDRQNGDLKHMTMIAACLHGERDFIEIARRIITQKEIRA